jgi:hypothetical protein
VFFPGDLRRQARVCARLAEECDDERLAERLRLMAADLAAKAVKWTSCRLNGYGARSHF